MDYNDKKNLIIAANMHEADNFRREYKILPQNFIYIYSIQQLLGIHDPEKFRIIMVGHYYKNSRYDENWHELMCRLKILNSIDEIEIIYI